ncbi:MAG: hypothetical protein Q8R47_04865 [Nanoarchaeota archaeon]|nr:hypothetical protein [Nanoarchaeota archaeon]
MQKKGGIFSKIIMGFGVLFILIIAMSIIVGMMASKTTNSTGLGSNDLATAQCDTYCNSIEEFLSPNISSSNEDFVCSCLKNYGEPNEETVGTKTIRSAKLEQDEKLLEYVEPYIKSVVTSDVNLRVAAGQITKECDSYYRKECEVNKIYRYIVEHFRYVADPNIQIVQPPSDTINTNGGDCEDLSILINSYLENVGQDTAVILTPSHAYSAVCNINTTALKNIATQSLLDSQTKAWTISVAEGTEGKGSYISKDSSVFYEYVYEPHIDILDSGYRQQISGAWLFNATNHDFATLKIKVDASDTLDFFVIESFEEYQRYIDNKPQNPSESEWESYYGDPGSHFKHYSECSRSGLSFSVTCEVSSPAVLFFVNRAPEGVRNKINVRRTVSFKIKDKTAEEWGFNTNLKMQTYTLNDDGVECLVLDPTAGTSGYPGYDWNLNASKVLVTTRGKEVKDFGYEEYLKSKGFI